MADDVIPRRCDINRQVYAERAIGDAMRAVEEMPAHPLLTEAVTLLVQARDKVADFVDLPTPKPTVEELKALLNSEDGRNVTINPDGSVRVHA